MQNEVIFDIGTLVPQIPKGRYFANITEQSVSNLDGRKIKLRSNRKFDLRNRYGKTVSVPYGEIFSIKHTPKLVVSHKLGNTEYYGYDRRLIPMSVHDPLWHRYFYDPICDELYVANDRTCKFVDGIPNFITKVPETNSAFQVSMDDGRRFNSFQVHKDWIQQRIRIVSQSNSTDGYGYFTNTVDDFGRNIIVVEPIFYPNPVALKHFHTPTTILPSESKIARFDLTANGCF